MIYDILPVNNYLGNNSTTAFEFDFLIENPTQLKVYLFDENNFKHELNYDIDYSISGIGNKNGGNIIFPIETSNYSILNENQKISLELDIPASQETQYNNSSLLNLSALEHSFDYLTRLIQILKRKLSLCIKVEECAANTPQELLDTINNSTVEAKQSSIEAKQTLNDTKLSLNEVKNIQTQIETLSGNIQKEVAPILNHSRLTNCLLEVPQKIKLELVDGVVTLKAGSKVILPNGAGVFDEIVTTKDLQLSAPTSAVEHYIYLKAHGGSIIGFTDVPSSSDTDIETKGKVHYNTSTNKVIRIGVASGAPEQFSFPIAKIVAANGVVTKIKEVFNGFGYIGSTIWVDKGVKGLVPNGRNADGSLRNIEYISPKVITRTYAPPQSNVYSITLTTNGYLSTYDYTIVSDDNYLLGVGKDVLKGFSVFSVSIVNGVITSLKPKLPFRAVDWNDAVLKSDKQEIISWAMPDYSAGITKNNATEYTAEYDGYLFIQADDFNGTRSYVTIDGNIWRIGYTNNNNGLDGSLIPIPMSKGTVYKVEFGRTSGASYTGQQIIFYPLKGAK